MFFLQWFMFVYVFPLIVYVSIFLGTYAKSLKMPSYSVKFSHNNLYFFTIFKLKFFFQGFRLKVMKVTFNQTFQNFFY